MNGALLERLEALWVSPALATWAMIAVAAVVAVIFVVILRKADRTLANGALVVITLLSLGVAAASLMRDKPAGTVAVAAPAGAGVGQAALACLDGLAGDRVETVCERALFASADSAAAAVSYTAAQVSRLPAAAAQGGAEIVQLRRVLERDRFGLVAQVLTVREGCTPQACDAFRHLTNSSQIAANMTGRAFETVVARYADAWGEASPQLAATAPAAPMAAASASRPTTIDFPSAASIPQVDIMTSPETPRRGAEPAPIVTVTQPPPAQAAAPAAVPAPAVAAAPAAPLPGSVPFAPSSLPQQSLPLQQPSGTQFAAPPPAPKAASNAQAQPKRAAPPKRPPAPAAAPPPVSLVPAQQEQPAAE